MYVGYEVDARCSHPPWDDVAAKMAAAAGDEKPMDILSWVCCCGEASHVVKSCAHYHIMEY